MYSTVGVEWVCLMDVLNMNKFANVCNFDKFCQKLNSNGVPIGHFLKSKT